MEQQNESKIIFFKSDLPKGVYFTDELDLNHSF